MIYLALIALTTLAANGARQLRYIAVGLAAVTATATVIGASVATVPELAVSGCAGLVAAGILFVAAGDGRYGEDPGWRLWAATFVAAIVTPVAYASFRTISGETASLAPLESPSEVIIEVAGIWLLSSGTAILLTARTAVRVSLAALLMISGVQLLVRLTPDARLGLTLILAWLEVVIALAGAFLVVNERAARQR
jgi:hypothetical protein